jgi:hypothetical protein
VDDKNELVASLRSVYDRWEKLLTGMSEEEITAPRFTGEWSVKDVVAHLMAWQQISIARLDAALRSSEPEFPAWLQGTDPYVAEGHTEVFNARIRSIYQGRPWSMVHQMWSEGFLRLIQLAEEIPQETMFTAGRYPWLKGDPLSAVLLGSCEHHQEHLDSLSSIFLARKSVSTD